MKHRRWVGFLIYAGIVLGWFLVIGLLREWFPMFVARIAVRAHGGPFDPLTASGIALGWGTAFDMFEVASFIGLVMAIIAVANARRRAKGHKRTGPFTRSEGGLS